MLDEKESRRRREKEAKQREFERMQERQKQLEMEKEEKLRKHHEAQMRQRRLLEEQVRMKRTGRRDISETGDVLLMNRRLLEKIQSKVNVKDILKRIPEKSPTVLQAARRKNKFL